jgi:hypothetical protein
MKWSNKGHEFDSLAEKLLRLAETKRFYIWGAGYMGDTIFKTLSTEIRILGYIDSNPVKQNSYMNGLLVYSPSKLQSENMDDVCVLVAAGWTKDIFGALVNYGFRRNENCFHIDAFLTVYMLYKYEKVFLSNMLVLVTEKCTLRCEKCVNMFPYFSDPRHFTLDLIKRECELLFKTVDFVSSLMLSGGDAMCNPECESIIKYLGDAYLGQKIGTIEVLTNAIIIPNENFLETLREYDCYVRFTDYSFSTKKQKLSQFIGLLEKTGIRYDQARYESWFDMGYPQETNGVSGEAALRKHFKDCDMMQCKMMTFGNFFFCGAAFPAERVGYCQADPDDYFDMNRNPIDKYEFVEFALGYSEKGFLNYCKKCNGAFNVNNIKIIPAVQIK